MTALAAAGLLAAAATGARAATAATPAARLGSASTPAFARALTAARTAAAWRPAAAYHGPAARRSGGGGDLAAARARLATLQRTYRHLDGVRVSIGSTPGGRQAVAYYTVGRIVINPRHRASITRIMDHEIWHIIDWRDNGRIDWRESVPPRGASRYRR